MDANFKKHPVWDSSPHAVDMENAIIIEQSRQEKYVGDPRDGDILLRPKEGETWPLVGSRGNMINEIMQDSKWWIHPSYGVFLPHWINSSL